MVSYIAFTLYNLTSLIGRGCPASGNVTKRRHDYLTDAFLVTFGNRQCTGMHRSRDQVDFISGSDCWWWLGLAACLLSCGSTIESETVLEQVGRRRKSVF